MKFVASKEAVLSALQQVSNIVGTRPSMPVLSNVLMEADLDSGMVSFTTTNLDMGIHCSLNAKISESGGVTLPTKKLFMIVKSLPGNDLTIEMLDNLRVKISSNGSTFILPGLDQTEFPKLSKIDEIGGITLGQEDFSHMLKNVSYAQSKDENRYILNGVYFSIEEDRINLVATDGRRLSLISKKFDEKIDFKSVIIPAKTVLELERMLGIGETLDIYSDGRQISFRVQVDGEGDSGLADIIRIVSKVVDGKYPNYKQVIPSTTEHRVRLDRERFLEMVQRVSIVADDKNCSIRFKIFNNSIEAHSFSQASGEANEAMAIAYEEVPVEAAFNPRFISDPLRALAKDEVYFEFKDELSPGVFKDTNGLVCVVMPLRLN
ncbi:MAG: DNA polymerase III subunit beta [Puniceicoccales bacterium]|jgi:DNA polymerase-3 subunit beta|nr:DNA polymerase III subunit beta [Puniceicoccales bacterium]